MRTFKDFTHRSEAEAFRDTVLDRNPRITIRRTTRGLGKNRRRVVFHVVNYDSEA